MSQSLPSMLITLLSVVALFIQPAWSMAARVYQNQTYQQNVTTYRTMYCSTLYGPSKISQPYPRTTSITVTHSHSSFTSTVTSITTSTPDTSTETDTYTSTEYTTLPVVTDTFTTTITESTTETDYDSTTLTETTTSTTTSTVTPTTTIATSSGFTPIALAPAVTSAGTPGKRDIYGRAPLPVIAVKAIALKDLASMPNGQVSASSYPTQVMCSRTVTYLTNTYFTSTLSSVSTATASQSTVTETTTITTTSTTSLPDASTTISTTTTETSTTTSTSSSTETTTVTTSTTVNAPSATAYAVCEDPNNYLTSINGSYVDLTTATSSQAVLTTSNVTSAYDCCNQCQRTKGCQIEIYSAGRQACYMIAKAGTCKPTSTLFNFYITSNNSNFPNGPLNITNTNCGQNVFAGFYN